MEEQKPLYKPEPGIPEALHTEIGNSAALEKDKHAFVLRIPDPSKQLESLITPVVPAAQINVASEESPQVAKLPSKESNLNQEISTPPAPEIKTEDTHLLPIENEIVEEDLIKPGKKKKETKEKKHVKEEISGKEDVGQVDEKPQKAGKLLRKAAKSVKKQEEGLKTASQVNAIRTEPALSPFTSWLKNLSGSDYVHPYDEDFALEQTAETSKGGISETFADLLASQGYKDQAREMYLKLMQKYPEKSGFFAAKIEALQ